MAVLIEGHQFGTVWSRVIHTLLYAGKTVSPRGLKTKEVTNLSIYVRKGLSNILFSQARDLNYKFMVAEWLWIQAGANDVESLDQYNSIVKNYSDDGISYAGAYGPRLKFQWKYVFDTLEKPNSRQAVATIWTPNPAESKDIPCTLNLQWLIRDDEVNCTINMRSSDAWLGLPYDFFNFSQLTNVVSSSFNLPVGSITMNLASSHLYEIHWETAKRMLTSEVIYTENSPQFKGIKVPEGEDLQALLKNPEIFVDPSFEKPWSDYAEALRCKSKRGALDVLRRLASE